MSSDGSATSGKPSKYVTLDGVSISTSGDAAPKPRTDPAIGDRMEDDTIYAGVSPDTGKPMYALPADATMTMRWREAMDYAAGLHAHGHKDWKLPSEAELDVLYQNRDKGALKGTFNTSGSFIAGWYWSSTEHPDGAWVERFSDGNRGWGWKGNDASVRPVRSEPRHEL